MDTLYLAQFVSIAAFIVNFVGLIQSNDEKFFNYAIISWVLFILHFGIMGEVNTMIACSIILVRIIVAKDHFRNYWLMAGFIGLSGIQLLVMFEDVYDILPIAASMIGTVSFFCFRGIMMRVLFMLSATCMLANAIILNSWGGMANEVFNIILLTIAIYTISQNQKKISPKKKAKA